MQQRQEQTARLTQSQRIAPQQIQANQLLQYSTLELLQAVAQEQRDNPALDIAEDVRDLPATCPDCPGGDPRFCPRCGARREDGLNRDLDFESRASDGELSGEDAPASGPLERIPSDGDGSFNLSLTDLTDFDPLLLARSTTTLADHLLLHLRATAGTPDLLRIGEYLVGCLDERGWLKLDLAEAVMTLDASPEEIEEAVRVLQSCDPPGIGARDLRECLLLQLQSRGEQGAEEGSYDALAERLVDGHWDALSQRRYRHLARAVGAPAARVEAALRFIQEHLTPHPAAQFRQPWDNRPDTPEMTVRPDVMIRRGGIGFVVEVTGYDNLSLQVNSHYRRLYDSIVEAREAGHAQTLSEHEKHVVAYVDRASLFLKNLFQRRRTIQKITEALIDFQQGYIETGQRAFLRPLTRTRLAQRIGMHESTVSRALLHKYVQLPSQEVVSFDIFFENAVTVKGAIAALIAEENCHSPLSDQSIVDLLLKRGIPIARRTVVKYREELRIPASYLRRRR